jgi:hypothetical protein
MKKKLVTPTFTFIVLFVVSGIAMASETTKLLDKSLQTVVCVDSLSQNSNDIQEKLNKKILSYVDGRGLEIVNLTSTSASGVNGHIALTLCAHIKTDRR